MKLNAVVRLNSSTQTASSEVSSALNPNRPRNAQGHRPTCICTVCKRLQDAIAAGKPTKAEARAAAHQRALARATEKTRPRNRRERQIAKASLVEGVIAGQVVSGVRPSIAKAAQIAGVKPRVAAVAAGDTSTVLAALAKVGITEERLDQVSTEGIDANETVLIRDRDGNVIDAIHIPDWHARHKFLRDLYMMIGRLGNDRESMPQDGGLVIISPNDATVIEGHPPACVCEECIVAWNEKTKILSRNAARAMAVDAEIVENPRSLPENLEGEDQDDEGDEADESWAGPSSS